MSTIPSATKPNSAAKGPQNLQGLNPGSGEHLNPGADLMEYCQTYAREKPEVVAFLCFGIGFVLGWKLKPW